MGVAIFNLGAIMTCVDGNDSSTTRDTGTNIAWGIFEYYTFFWIVTKTVGMDQALSFQPSVVCRRQ